MPGNAEKIFIGSYDCIMYALSASTGEILWTYKTNGIIKSAPCTTSDFLIFGMYLLTLICTDIVTYGGRGSLGRGCGSTNSHNRTAPIYICLLLFQVLMIKNFTAFQQIRGFPCGFINFRKQVF